MSGDDSLHFRALIIVVREESGKTDPKQCSEKPTPDTDDAGKKT